MRADARRNREKIISAARAAFAEPGAQPSMADVSRRAGVGMATLYRNFPGRRELLEALYTDEVDAVCRAAETVEGETPGEVLAAWLQRFFAFLAGKRGIASELLEHTGRDDEIFGGSRARVLAAAEPLLVTAQRSHEVRDDVSLEQVMDMIAAIARIDGDPEYLRPILRTTLDGLRPVDA